MSSTGLIIALVIVLAGTLWVAFPLLQQAKRRASGQSRERDELLTLYERVLSAIRDLDEDFQTGKLAAEEHQEERAVWVQRGVKILHRLEETGISSDAGSNEMPVESIRNSADDDLEALIASYVKSKSST